MSKPSLDHLAGFIESLRPVVLLVGLASVVANTVPALPLRAWYWPDVVLWLCFSYYVLEWAVHVSVWRKATNPRAHFVSLAHLADAMAVVPIVIAHAVGVAPATAWLMGSFWLLKLPAATSGFSLLGRVFLQEAKPLACVVVVFTFVFFMSAVAVHLFEREAQPNAFGTLPSALYWALTTLTTTGYGDLVPATTWGRITAGIVMISGLAVFGLWTGILATGFAAETRRRDFVRTWEIIAKVPFFRPLSPAAIIDIARMLRPLEAPERTVIVRRGRQGDCMYFIADGQVEVTGSGPPVQLGPGAFFGEMALLGGGVRTATVTATMPTTLLVLDVTDYRIFAAHYPELARAVEAEAARRAAERPASLAKS